VTLVETPDGERAIYRGGLLLSNVEDFGSDVIEWAADGSPVRIEHRDGNQPDFSYVGETRLWPRYLRDALAPSEGEASGEGGA
jgi:hypothetical protein